MPRNYKFEITCDENNQFYINGKPVDKRGCGWRQKSSGKWYYSKEANIIDRLQIALENSNISNDELERCKTQEELKELWKQVKKNKYVGINHPVYLDPASSCEEAVARLSEVQPVKRDGEWYGSTICFTGQMFDKDGTKITRKEVRKIANNIGFTWLENITIGCVFLVTGEYKTLTNKTKKAMGYGTSILSPLQFWELVEDSLRNLS